MNIKDKLHVGIVAIPERMNLVNEKINQLDNNYLDLEVFSDEEKQGYNWNYERAFFNTIEKCVEEDEYALILTDDSILCNNFIDKLNELLEKSNYQNIYCLTKLRSVYKDRIRSNDKGYYTSSNYLSDLYDMGILIKKPKINLREEFNNFNKREVYFAYTEIGTMLKSLGQSWVVSLPCLIDHNISVESSLGNKVGGSNCFIDNFNFRKAFPII